MKPAIATNFRGWRAVVIHRPDENRQRLAEVLPPPIPTSQINSAAGRRTERLQQ